MMGGSKAIQLTGSLNYVQHSGITEFNYIARINIDQMVVLDTLISFLKLGYVFTKLVFYYQIAIKK